MIWKIYHIIIFWTYPKPLFSLTIGYKTYPYQCNNRGNSINSVLNLNLFQTLGRVNQNWAYTKLTFSKSRGKMINPFPCKKLYCYLHLHIHLLIWYACDTIYGKLHKKSSMWVVVQTKWFKSKLMLSRPLIFEDWSTVKKDLSLYASYFENWWREIVFASRHLMVTSKPTSSACIQLFSAMPSIQRIFFNPKNIKLTDGLKSFLYNFFWGLVINHFKQEDLLQPFVKESKVFSLV